MSIMSEEEAIERLKERVKLDRKIRNNKIESDYEQFCENECQAIETILNLADKQRKEIEEKNVAINKMSKDISKQLEEIEEKRIIIFAGAEKVKQLEKEIEKLKEKEQNLIFQLKDEEKELIEVTQNIISKDKIMAKIEELEKKAKEMKYDYDVSYAEEDLFNKNVKFFKEQMQELLEEPKLLEEN